MSLVDTYSATEKIRETPESLLYRGCRSTDGAPVLVKVLGHPYPMGRELAALQHEYAMLQGLPVDGVVKVIGLEPDEHGLALVMEDPGGSLLSDSGAAETLDLTHVLRIAIGLADTLAQIHRSQVVHKDVKPTSVFVDRDSLHVTLIDFGIAARLPQGAQGGTRQEPSDTLEGTLAYISPEQTGRMNRSIDARSDLYSLGVVLYELLTGVLPFPATNLSELVHSHIARQPVPPHEIRPAVPEPLSRIVVKLLAKAAEDRYQSAFGLKADLEECLGQWTRDHEIRPFTTGTQDFGDAFRIPQKLYGRDAEIATLFAAFEHASQGGAELLLVAGPAGVGKSALVQELRKPIVRRGASFVAGKFEQFDGGVPFAPFAQAFQELVRSLLSEREEVLAVWREKLQVALGRNGQVVVTLIPELELIVGPQPPVLDLGPTETQNRFALVFQRFVRVFTTAEHPLVLFLDDLQWADPASQKLLQLLLTDPQCGHLLIVGAYREADVTASHPLAATLRALVEEPLAAVSTIALRPLDLAQVTEFLDDTLRCGADRAGPLARWTFEKTQGNPFFLIQFVRRLHDEGLLRFDPEARTFHWDEAAIAETAVTENVVAFMAEKLVRLSPAAQDLLKLAACLGHRFGLNALAAVAEMHRFDVGASLGEALREGLIVPQDTSYRFSQEKGSGWARAGPDNLGAIYGFLHDRVQQATYALMGEEERRSAHLRIGRWMRDRERREGDDNLFEVVRHLNIGAPLMVDASERRALAKLDLRGAQNARASTADAMAVSLLDAGIALLPPTSWDDDYPLTYDLFLASMTSNYLGGHRERSQSLCATLLAHARAGLDTARVHSSRASVHATVGEFAEAIRAGREGLACLGVDLPAEVEAQKALITANTAFVESQLATRTLEDLANEPVRVDTNADAASVLLTAIAAPAYLTDSTILYRLVILEQAKLTLQHGPSKVAYRGYMGLGLVAAVHGQYKRAFELGQLELELDKKLNDGRTDGRLLQIFSLFSHHLQPLRETLRQFELAARLGVEAGDLIAGAYAGLGHLQGRIALGDPLPELRTEAETLIVTFPRDPFAIASATAMLQLIATLEGPTDRQPSVGDGTLDERTVLRTVQERGFSYAMCTHYAARLQILYLDRDYAGALAAAEDAERHAASATGQHLTTEIAFFTCLTLAAHLRDHPTDTERGERMRRLHARIEKWADACPANYLHKSQLVSAEIAHLSGDEVSAMRLYDQAIETARQNGFVRDETLGNELAARFHLAYGRGFIARAYLVEARYGYARWGAIAKVQDLDQTYPELRLGARASALMAADTRWVDSTTEATDLPHAPSCNALDLLSVIKATQTISSEIDLEKLVCTLLQVLLEEGGARKGYLMLSHEGALWLKAEAILEEGGVVTKMLPGLPVASSPLLPASVVRYVWRTKERVIVDDADASRFSVDPYIARHKAKSLLCLPVVRQAEVVALLYLEHDLVVGAFTPDRLSVLELLAAQAAISLENALLLEQERKARAASDFLAQAGAVIAESLDYANVPTKLARLVVQSFADWCVIDLVEEGEIRRVSGAHRDPAKEPLLEELQRRYPPSWDSPHPAATVLRTGRSYLSQEVTDDQFRQLEEAHGAIIRALGTRTLLSVPLVARSQILGSLTAASASSDRTYGRTELDLAQEIAHRAAAAIDNARLYRDMQEALRLRDEFLSLASHELKTPITSLTLAVQALRRHQTKGRLEPEVADKLIKIMEHQGGRLTRLIGEILDVPQIQAGRLSYRFEDGVDLVMLVQEVVSCVRTRREASARTVSVRVIQGVSGRWDRLHLEEVVEHLLSNAIKFGGDTPIEIVIDREGELAHLTVSDHGIGIEPSIQGRLFERFTRGVAANNYGGLGLGLYLTRTIVEAHEGTIRVDSQPGMGATFTVELPVAGPGRADRS